MLKQVRTRRIRASVHNSTAAHAVRMPFSLRRLVIIACAVALTLTLACISLLQGPRTVLADPASADSTGATQPTTWPDFRGSPTNNAITDALTPRTKTDAGVKWTAKFSSGYVSPQIIVNDEVIVTSGRGSKGVITKLNKDTGAVIASASMKNASAYSLMPPTYADGKIFVTLSGGSMEAFDATTLKSLWYYQNAAGGQGNCPIVYSDGLVYTGYWTGEEAERSFVCLDASNGKLVWEHKNIGGYYWAGAVAIGDYLVFGGDDGAPASTSGTSYVRCVNKRTGAEISKMAITGDQRSSIVYDADQGRVYFTSKPGYLHSAAIDAQTGALSGLLSVKLDTETTATPLVYDRRVYVGASSGSFASGSFSVVDASSLKLLYKLGKSEGIGGTVKAAPLVSTAYVGSSAQADGKLYLYFTANYPPGGITALAVEPNSTAASQAKVINLFTPPKVLQQYCIASVICDNDGNLYYRNDSNYLMCVGPGGVDPEKYVVPVDPDPTSSSSSTVSPTKSSSTKSSSSSASKSSSSKKSSSKASSSSSTRSSSAKSTSPQKSKSSGVASQLAGSSVMQSTYDDEDYDEDEDDSSDDEEDIDGDEEEDIDEDIVDDAEDDDATPLADSTRHTDAQAATAHLGSASTENAPAIPTPVIIAIIAIIALAGLAIARAVVAQRNDTAADAASNTTDTADDGAGEPHER